LKKIICLLLSLILLSATVSAKTVSSEGEIDDIDVPLKVEETSAQIGETLDIKAKSAILMEANTGKILYESNADERLSPASVTKVMSLLLVMEAIDRGDFDYETVVSASAHACSMGGSQIWLEEGESMTVHDLLKATVIASANDACVALGELVSGSEEGFVALMNKRAKELGMNNTTFINCTGLDAEGHLTTAHDIAVMSSKLIAHEKIKEYSTVWMDSLRNGESELVNTNKLIRFYEGATGLKTGTTSIAKYCLSATAERDGLSLVAVIMAGDTSTDRFEGAKKLLNYGFANYSYSTVEPKLKKSEIEISGGVKKTLSIKADGTVELLMPKREKGNISRKTVWKKKIKAPVKKGDIVGYVNIYSDDTEVGKIPIKACENVKKLDIPISIGWILSEIFKN